MPRGTFRHPRPAVQPTTAPPRIRRAPPDAATIAQARRLRADGMSVTAIGAKLGLNKSTAHRIVADVPADARAAANKTRADALPPWLHRVRALTAAGMSRNAAAKRIGVSKSALYRALDKFGP